jgi:hypothetical protein
MSLKLANKHGTIRARIAESFVFYSQINNKRLGLLAKPFNFGGL